MSSNVDPEQRSQNDNELTVLMKNIREQTGSDMSQTKKLLEYMIRNSMHKNALTGVEMKEDLECQLMVSGQLETIVVDVAAFSNGKPYLIGIVIPDMDAMAHDELSDFVTWRLIAAYAHSGWTSKTKMTAVILGKKSHQICTSLIDRELVSKVAQAQSRSRFNMEHLTYDEMKRA